MRIAIIGRGKTGGALISLLEPNQIIGPFGQSNSPTKSALNQADAVICFVPATAVPSLIDLLLGVEVPIIWGVTGYDWPSSLEKKITARKRTWLKSNNFSLIMPLVLNAIKSLSMASTLIPETNFAIHEVHHMQKVDAPSGTAINWASNLGEQTDITSERIGDVVGNHKLTIETPDEVIELIHMAKNRQLFARGALWAAQKLITTKLNPGFYDFNDLVDQTLLENTK